MTELEQLFRTMIEKFGDDPAREGVRKTPARAAHAWSYITGGIKVDPRKIVGDAIYDAPGAGVSGKKPAMVLVRDIELYSLCEHHLLPFFGRCHVAYFPDKKIIGLSKIPRLVNNFARRLQLQEKLSSQIADTLEELLQPRGIAVLIEARHLCMVMRGVRSHQSVTHSEEFRGCFDDPSLRADLHRRISQPSSV